MEKDDLLWELETAGGYLSQDIQAFSYLLEDLNAKANKTKELVLMIPEIIARGETILRAMMYNKENIFLAVDKVYADKNKRK